MCLPCMPQQKSLPDSLTRFVFVTWFLFATWLLHKHPLDKKVQKLSLY